ncbi:hypothetical protein RB213_005879 [Colletotrichum asianum]
MQIPITFVTTVIAFSGAVSALPQAITGKATDFGTYFCQTRTDAGSKIVANNNFCKAAGGAVLASEGITTFR